MKKQDTQPTKKDDGKIRLNKYVANSGVCSRRDADIYIGAGSVKVNGKVVVEMGYKVSLDDDVYFDDRRITPEKKEYVLLNKPKGFITTTNDERNRKTVMELVSNASRNRILPVGRLDRNTTGLLLFTNDGLVAKKLTHPKYKVKKIYHAQLDRNLTFEDLTKIKKGLTLDDGKIFVDEVSYVDNSPKNEIGIEIHSGKNRIVRRIFEHLNYNVIKLDRVIFGDFDKKNLTRGRWRHLTEQEINKLNTL